MKRSPNFRLYCHCSMFWIPTVYSALQTIYISVRYTDRFFGWRYCPPLRSWFLRNLTAKWISCRVWFVLSASAIMGPSSFWRSTAIYHLEVFHWAQLRYLQNAHTSCTVVLIQYSCNWNCHGMQVQFSLLSMGDEQMELKTVCDSLGIRLIAYSPLGLGMLTGKYTTSNLPSGPR